MRIVTKQEMYEADRYVIEVIGIGNHTLMELAGLSVSQFLCKGHSTVDRIVVLIGKGNNGGDGFIIARHLLNLGFQVKVWMVPTLNALHGAAKYAHDVFVRSGYTVRSVSIDGLKEALSDLAISDIIIDCLLGLGVDGVPRTPYNQLINQVNRSKAKVISIDLPSGLPTDEGEVTLAVKADQTVTLQAAKTGAFLFPQADYYGEVHCVDIGIPPTAFSNAIYRRTWRQRDVQRTLPSRKNRNVYKSKFGKGCIIAGSEKMPGAAVLTTKAALRSGLGLTTLTIPNTIYNIASSHITESMYIPLPSSNGHFTGSTTINEDEFSGFAIGPGIGREQGSYSIVKETLTYNKPVVVDADALHFIPRLKTLIQNRSEPTILTPHSAEMANLLGREVAYIERNRFKLSRQYAMQNNLYLVLKGPHTIVTTPSGDQFVNMSGNPALAKGGSGDVLTGMILAFILQHDIIQQAISNAVWIHGLAADLLTEQSQSPMSVTASDLINTIPQVLHTVEG